jgi:hypothetical protein
MGYCRQIMRPPTVQSAGKSKKYPYNNIKPSGGKRFGTKTKRNLRYGQQPSELKSHRSASL